MRQEELVQAQQLHFLPPVTPLSYLMVIIMDLQIQRQITRQTLVEVEVDSVPRNLNEYFW